MTESTLFQFAVNAFHRANTGMLITLVLLLLLTQKEMLRAHGGPSAQRGARAFNIAVEPLLIVFGLIIAIRALRLLNMV